MSIYTILAIGSPIVSAIAVVLLISMIWPPGAPWVPTPRRKARLMMEMAALHPGELVYDLGSGDGRALLIAARHFKARAIGIEIDPLRFLFSQALITVLGLRGQVRIVWGDIFKQDLSDADVIVCYLLQQTNERLTGKFQDELRPDVRIVSHAFIFPDWTPVEHNVEEKLYLYRLPTEAAGQEA